MERGSSRSRLLQYENRRYYFRWRGAVDTHSQRIQPITHIHHLEGQPFYATQASERPTQRSRREHPPSGRRLQPSPPVLGGWRLPNSARYGRYSNRAHSRNAPEFTTTHRRNHEKNEPATNHNRFNVCATVDHRKVNLMRCKGGPLL